MMFNTHKTYRTNQFLMQERMAEAKQHELARTVVQDRAVPLRDGL